jgi:hypothetical protein
MNTNEIILCCALGRDGFMQYQQYKEMIRTAQEAQMERERQEHRKRWKYIGSVLWHSIEPTVDFIQKWDDVNLEHPNVERCFVAGEYALKIGKIAYDKHAEMNYQY